MPPQQLLFITNAPSDIRRELLIYLKFDLGIARYGDLSDRQLQVVVNEAHCFLKRRGIVIERKNVKQAPHSQSRTTKKGLQHVIQPVR